MDETELLRCRTSLVPFRPDVIGKLNVLMRSTRWQIAVIGLGTSTTQLDTSVNIAFPAITSGFQLAIGDIQWVVISYVLTYASLLLALGRIGDTIGHAVVYRAGLLWSAIAFLLVAFAPSYPLMLIARCLQGVGAALILSCGIALVISLYGEERRSWAIGVFTMMTGFGVLLGPLLGGILVALWDWPSVFWFRAPIALAALLLLRGLPAHPPRTEHAQIDIVSTLALVLGLVTLLLTLNRIREWTALPLALAFIVALAAFVLRQSRSEKPIVDFRVFRRPGFAVINSGSILVNASAFSVWMLVPYFLTRVNGYSLAASGAVLSTGALGVIIASQIGGRLLNHRLMSADRLAPVGALGVAAGLAMLGMWTEDTPTALRVIGLFVQGLGLGLFQLAYTDVVTAALPVEDRGVAGSLALLTRTLGTVSAASLLLMLFEGLQLGGGFFTAFRQTLLIAAGLAFATALLMILRPRRIVAS